MIDGLLNRVGCPWLIIEKRFIEYNRLRKIMIDMIGIKIINLDINEEIKIISLIKLIEGGALMLEAKVINQIMEIIGEIVKHPFIM